MREHNLSREPTPTKLNYSIPLLRSGVSNSKKQDEKLTIAAKLTEAKPFNLLTD